MADEPLASIHAFDLRQSSPRAILDELVARRMQSHEEHAVEQSLQFKISGASGQDFVGAGLRGVAKVSVEGSLGEFCFCSFGEGDCFIEGKVGAYFGHSMQSGILIVHGHASHSVGALARGGTIAIYGNASDRAAIGMQGADLVIRGSVGDFAGLGLQSGSLIIGGNAGKELGKGMKAGAIYIRGDAESISSDVEEQRVREPDRLKIGLVLLKAGIKSAGKDFRVYRSAKDSD
jgi:glutamate synthase domain-containing protein 3